MFAAAQSIRQVLRGIKRDKSLNRVDDELIPLADYYELVGLGPQLAREKSYDEAAAAIVRARAARR
jgi:hypothetical protein